MSTRKKKEVVPTGRKGMTGFEFGAKVLEINVDALIDIYDTTVSVMVEGIKAGKTNAPMGFIALLAYTDLLHGGSYAAPLNQIPWHMTNKALSKYYPGNLQQLPTGPGADNYNEILWDANVPHVFPKLLSDETFGRISILFSQANTVNFFSQVSTGVTHLVEGLSLAQKRSKGGDGTKKAEKTFSEEEVEDMFWNVMFQQGRGEAGTSIG